MSEYVEFTKEFSNISFSDDPSRRNKDTSLFQLETANIIPANYFVDNVRQYKRVYTWNGKLVEGYKKEGIEAVKIPNFPLFDNYFYLEEFKSFEERIDGICLICRARGPQNLEFDISHKRVLVFEEIDGMEKHAYGKLPYAGDYYKGVIGDVAKETYPSSKSKLQKLNEYKFNLCFENAYHELWSWDYITEKIIDCFRAKTIPVYYGCYNIEDRIPKNLYVDYRRFGSVAEMIAHLKSINKNEFEDMTETALEWEKKTKLGNIEELRGILKND